MRNVTAIASAGTNAALRASIGADDAVLTVNATNVIAQGPAAGSDVAGLGFPCCMNQAININLANSNYDSEDETSPLATTTITNPGTGTNVSAPVPAFVDAANGDFRQTAASTGTINRGIADAGLGAFDLNGLDRLQGTAPDIGAHEFPEAAPPARRSAGRRPAGRHQPADLHATGGDPSPVKRCKKGQKLKKGKCVKKKRKKKKKKKK